MSLLKSGVCKGNSHTYMGCDRVLSIGARIVQVQVPEPMPRAKQAKSYLPTTFKALLSKQVGGGWRLI